ncbi:glycosyltransferase family 4 protein [Helicobacter himalayensis]|uniref:glycosyltransferase family 4 protein n=1 Tax=Helicobacter himalayensis TaxID=1591088 RepID=UPI00082D5336|nr:MraY family glycosyltransferase [Helicobacter himalayensis]
MISEHLIFSSIVGFVASFCLCVMAILTSKHLYFFVDSANSKKPQRFHTDNTSRAGGVGIFIAFCCSYMLFFGYDRLMLGLLFGAFIIFFSGLAEDFSSSLNPKIRLILQCFGAFLACFLMSVYIKDLSLGFELPKVLGVLFSIFALVGVTNAINIIDGFNGLASGICLLIFGAIGFVAFEVKDKDIFEICILIIMAILGFLVLNFPKGKIFLGDGGAYFLGFLAGFLLILLTQKNANVSTWFGFSVMIYPVWEVLFSIYRRKSKKLQAMQPDDLHLHTLLFSGLSKRTRTSSFKNAQTSLLLWICNAPFIILSCMLYQNTSALIVLSVSFMVLYSFCYVFLRRKV